MRFNKAFVGAVASAVLLSQCVFADNVTTDINCTVTNTVQHQPVGDLEGKIVMTGAKVYRKCDVHYKERGGCLEWEETHDEFSVNKFAEIAKIEQIHNGNIGQAMATLGAVTQSMHMFNGVHARCAHGTEQDFNWLNDPMFWAGLLMSYLGSSSFSDSFVNELGTETITDAAGNVVKDATGEALKQTIVLGAKDTAFAQMWTVMGDYAVCAAGAAVSMAESAKDLAQEDDSECDPVDEFCGHDAGALDDPGEVQTLTLSEYSQMVAQDPSSVDYIEIIDDGTQSGYVVFRFKNPGEFVDPNGSAQAIADAREAARKKQAEIKMGITAVKALGCIAGASSEVKSNYPEAGGGKAGGGGGDKAGGKVDVVGMVAGMLPFPYNMIAGVVLKIFQSYTPIDSCGDEDDANVKGKFHVRAYTGLRFDTCHETDKEEVIEKWPLTGDPMLYERKFCCYDAPMSRILMVQMHAQVGKDYLHCTDITLNELSYMSWRQCSPSEMTSGKDGAKIMQGEDMKESYQYKFQCMNLGPFKQYIESQVPQRFEDTQVSEMLERMSGTIGAM